MRRPAFSLAVAVGLAVAVVQLQMAQAHNLDASSVPSQTAAGANGIDGAPVLAPRTNVTRTVNALSAAAVGTALPAPLPASSGPTFYVSPTGSDANVGSLARPWRTIQKALRTVRPGETVLVRGGTYPEWMYMTRSGAAGAPVTIRGYPGEKPRITGRFKIQQAAYVRVSGFVFQGSTAANNSEPLVYVSGGRHIEISKNEITAAARYGGIFLEDAHNVHIISNWLHDNGTIWNLDHGIYWKSGVGGLITNNVIDKSRTFGIQLYPYVDGVVTSHNTITRSGRAGILIGGERDGTADKHLLVNNIVAFNGEEGIRTGSSGLPGSGNVATHNVVWGNNTTGKGAGDYWLPLPGLSILSDIRKDPRLTSSFALQPDSPALDAARPEYSLPYDYASTARPQGAGPDLGALELAASSLKTGASSVASPAPGVLGASAASPLPGAKPSPPGSSAPKGAVRAKLQARGASSVPAAAFAGRVFAFHVRVVTERGAPVRRGLVQCRAHVGKTPLSVVAKRWRNSVARCSWIVPKSARAKKLRGLMRLESEVRGRLEVSFARRVR